MTVCRCPVVQKCYSNHDYVQVSWLREDTMSILSAGLYTYISNTRFIARHLEDEDIWTLAIRQEEFIRLKKC